MEPNNKVAIVTGSARGLGRAIAARLADDGINVACWDLNLEGAQETAKQVEAKF